MEFEYDLLKSEANRLKHGISFEEAKGMWDVPGMIIQIEFPAEKRFARVVLWGNKFYTSVVTLRGDAIRIISVRRSREEEQKIYEEKFKNEKKENE